MASPEEIIADERTIQNYIPQRPPIVMVGKLHSASGNKTVTSFIIEKDNLFCSGDLFREPGLIENIAQTAAAGEGYRASLEGKRPRTGFLGGIKNLQIHYLPSINDEIITEAVVEHELVNVTIIHGKVFKDQVIIAECEMKVFF
jgi:hypothetical protein